MGPSMEKSWPDDCMWVAACRIMSSGDICGVAVMSFG